jgi:hypothetical protein
LKAYYLPVSVKALGTQSRLTDKIPVLRTSSLKEDPNDKSTMAAVKEENCKLPPQRMTWRGDIWGQEFFFEAVNLESD